MNYAFTLVLNGASPDTSDFEDNLFEAGCDDALVCFCGSTPYLEFDREADSAVTAISTAIEAVQSAGYRVVSIEQAGFVTLTAAAKLADINKQTLNNYTKGIRGAGDFPAPRYGLQSGTPLYYWPQIANWLVAQGKVEPLVAEIAGAAVELTRKLEDDQGVLAAAL
ncbi:MAG: hypothetical protein ACPGMR_10420 [Pontibacterium sp.]